MEGIPDVPGKRHVHPRERGDLNGGHSGCAGEGACAGCVGMTRAPSTEARKMTGNNGAFTCAGMTRAPGAAAGAAIAAGSILFLQKPPHIWYH